MRIILWKDEQKEFSDFVVKCRKFRICSFLFASFNECILSAFWYAYWEVNEYYFKKWRDSVLLCLTMLPTGSYSISL